MSMESSSEDGSDIFWPGYVDAVTNLVLNLLFLLTIMTVAVFMFAMELSRRKDGVSGLKSEAVTTQEVVKIGNNQVPDPQQQQKTQQIHALQEQIRQLQQQVQHKLPEGGPQKIIEASRQVETPTQSLDKEASGQGGLVVNFVRDAVGLTDGEMATLRTALAPIVSSGGAHLKVTVPKGFSEAKRLGFYRAMAVRNLLIEMNLPAEKIEVSVRESPKNADASQVRVTGK